MKPPDACVPPARQPTARSARPRLHREALVLGWHYLWRTEMEPLGRPLGFVRRLWALGWPERTVLLWLGILTVSSALATSQVLAPHIAEAILGSTHLGLFVVAWAVSFAAAAAQPSPLALSLISPWLVFYSILVTGAWRATPIAVAPALWLAFTLWCLAQARPSRITGVVWWLPVAMALGYVLPGASGLRRFLGWDLLVTQALVATGLGAIGVIGCLGLRQRAAIGFAGLLWGAQVTGGLAVLASVAKDWGFTVDWTRIVVADAAGLVMLFWFWTAGSFAAESVRVTKWTVRRSVKLIPRAWVRVGVPITVALVTVAEWLIPHASGPSWLARLTGIFGSAARSDPLQAAMFHGRIWAGLGTLGYLASWQWRGRLSHARAVQALTGWLVIWLGLHAVWAGSQAVVTSGSSGRLVGVGLVVTAVGLLLELGKMEREWSLARPEHIRVQLGLVAVAVACAVVVSTTPGAQWDSPRTLLILAGMLHLGVPLALYDWSRRRWRGPARLDVLARLEVCAGGYATALLALALDPRHALVLLLGVPVLAGLLVLLRRARPDVARSGGILAGALFGGGLGAGWMMPYPPTLPFLPRPPWVDLLRDWGQLGRPPLSGLHLTVVLATWVIGGGMGWWVFRNRAV